jgi:hypothetical protein
MKENILECLTDKIEAELKGMLEQNYDIRTIACELAEVTRDLVLAEIEDEQRD